MVKLKTKIMKKVRKDHVLVLKTVDKDMKSYGGFQWPKKGYVKCDDFDPEPECGNGLHGFLKGEGSGLLANWDQDAAWLVLEVLESKIIDLEGKVKFPDCNVLYAGERSVATKMIYDVYHTAVIGGTATAGYHGTATAGYHGTATAGHRGTATAGDRGTATARDDGTATAGNYGTATTGDYGTATAGHRGTATAGYRGTATAGNYGTATTGHFGIIQIAYYDGRRKVKIGYIEEDGLKANVAYVLNDSFEFVEKS